MLASPKGSLEATLLSEGVKVGDILRAEAEFEIDGIVVMSVQAPKGDTRSEKSARIEIIGSGHDNAPSGVSVVLVPGGRRRGEGQPRRSSTAQRSGTGLGPTAQRRTGRVSR